MTGSRIDGLTEAVALDAVKRAVFHTPIDGAVIALAVLIGVPIPVVAQAGGLTVAAVRQYVDDAKERYA